MHSTAPGTASSSIRGCTEFANLYQHPLLEEPPSASAPAELRRRHLMMVRQAENLCRECPLMAGCLYDAVVKHDVSGYVGATSAKQRQDIRNRLRVRVEPEDFDTLAGASARHRQVDHDEVVRLRTANPHESLEVLAHRLGCSLSTVKRHLRKHRVESHLGSDRRSRSTPTTDQVIEVYRQVTAPRQSGRKAA